MNVFALLQIVIHVFPNTSHLVFNDDLLINHDSDVLGFQSLEFQTDFNPLYSPRLRISLDRLRQVIPFATAIFRLHDNTNNPVISEETLSAQQWRDMHETLVENITWHLGLQFPGFRPINILLALPWTSRTI